MAFNQSAMSEVLSCLHGLQTVSKFRSADLYAWLSDTAMLQELSCMHGFQSVCNVRVSSSEALICMHGFQTLQCYRS